MVLLWVLAAHAEPARVDLQAYTDWRREVRGALEEAGAACPVSELRLRFTLHVQPDGRLTEPAADLIGLPPTAGLDEEERGRVAAAAAASQRCFEASLASLSLPRPPGARGVTLPELWFDFGSSTSPEPAPVSAAARAPRLDPPGLDSAEVRDGLVAVIWAGEGAVLACLPADQGPTELNWVVARTGHVAAVEPVAGVSPEAERCVHGVVRRWVFPALDGVDEVVRMRHVVDPGA